MVAGVYFIRALVCSPCLLQRFFGPKFANLTHPDPRLENTKFSAISAFKISKIKFNKIYTNFQFPSNFTQIWKFISNLDRILLA
jgi:outer membrane lipoprotein mapA